MAELEYETLSTLTLEQIVKGTDQVANNANFVARLTPHITMPISEEKCYTSLVSIERALPSGNTFRIFMSRPKPEKEAVYCLPKIALRTDVNLDSQLEELRTLLPDVTFIVGATNIPGFQERIHVAVKKAEKAE